MASQADDLVASLTGEATGARAADRVTKANGSDRADTAHSAPTGGPAARPPARASLVDSPLDGAERDRLTALRAATTENAGLHIAILAALSEAATTYRLQMRTAELLDRLTAGLASDPQATNWSDLNEAGLRQALDQLRGWRCVDWVQDPSVRATSIEEYLRRHELWELTPVGASALAAVEAVLGATEEAGALQRTMFRQIREALDKLVEAVALSDADGTYLQLRDLDLALAQLASNAREFYATVNRIAREERLDDHVFLLYKDQLITYLQSFHDDLVRNRSLISDQLTTLDRSQRQLLLDLAREGDDSVGLFGEEADWAQRWDGMLSWFVPGRAERTEADALAGATTVAIRELLTLLRRLTEQSSRPVNRASELQETAAWFSRCASDEDAHRLFDAAFGLSPVDHVGLAVDDPEAHGPFPSWWTIDPVDVPLSLRTHGRRPARGGTARRRDYSVMKKQLAHERQQELAVQLAAADRLVSIDLTAERVSEAEWPVLLAWLDQALAARPAASEFSTTVRTERAVVELATADHDTRLVAPAGSVVLRRCRVWVYAA